MEELNQEQRDLRIEEEVDLELGSSGVLSEDLNNPCRESELKAMYEKLSRGQWADFVWNLRTASSDSTKRSEEKDKRKKAENIIEEVLKLAAFNSEKTKDDMKKCFELNTEDPSDIKTSKHFDLCIHHLQRAIFYQKEKRYKTDISKDGKQLDIPDDLHPLVDDCYKVVCLMCLHNPPILLDWDKCGQRPFPPIKIEETEPILCEENLTTNRADDNRNQEKVKQGEEAMEEGESDQGTEANGQGAGERGHGAAEVDMQKEKVVSEQKEEVMEEGGSDQGPRGSGQGAGERGHGAAEVDMQKEKVVSEQKEEVMEEGGSDQGPRGSGQGAGERGHGAGQVVTGKEKLVSEQVKEVMEEGESKE